VSAKEPRARTLNAEEYKAVWRVLTLLDGYLSTLPPHTLQAWEGGTMTWGELRLHAQAGIKLLEKKAKPRRNRNSWTTPG
jgi:hypothetical protein